MKLPVINANYAEFEGFMSESEQGLWILDSISEDGKKALFVNESPSGDAWRNQYRNGTILPDGRITTASLNPYGRYLQIQERLIPHPYGDVLIEGEFPDFYTQAGERVWLDFDRSMVTYPVDYLARMVAHKRAIKRASRIGARYKKMRASLAVRVARHGVNRLSAGGYAWFSEIDGEEGEGYAETRVQAERDLLKWERERLGNQHRAKVKECLSCGVSIEHQKAGSKYCSTLCRMRYHRRKS